MFPTKRSAMDRNKVMVVSTKQIYLSWNHHLLPGKLTKINGWKLEDVFPIEIVPLSGTC